MMTHRMTLPPARRRHERNVKQSHVEVISFVEEIVRDINCQSAEKTGDEKTADLRRLQANTYKADHATKPRIKCHVSRSWNVSRRTAINWKNTRAQTRIETIAVECLNYFDKEFN